MLRVPHPRDFPAKEQANLSKELGQSLFTHWDTDMSLQPADRVCIFAQAALDKHMAMPAAFTSPATISVTQGMQQPPGTCRYTLHSMGNVFSSTACRLRGGLKHGCCGVGCKGPVLHPPPLPPDSEGLMVSFDVQMSRASAMRSPMDLWPPPL